eukprot:352920-Chlamydomonas_euryale.AAC.2
MHRTSGLAQAQARGIRQVSCLTTVQVGWVRGLGGVAAVQVGWVRGLGGVAAVQVGGQPACGRSDCCPDGRPENQAGIVQDLGEGCGI